ncbi:DUF305 domain-containing protein [Nocardia uniformis]|uniref:DUF305 domain-containing protein n=1 Tax=Nocardia uniformis TaxID=53432 RepID=A0A849CFZ8_9NOCA|nr:DUF305 domain-containing protein [Nocardia uniformis]NNH75820.1 DUF305 domain-containing protein [Nocardia uniformis]
MAVLLIGVGMALRPVLVPQDQATPSVMNPTEIGFAQDMLLHHQQALFMVQRLDPAADPAIKQLAQQISDSQRVEIGTMLGWLRLANASPTNPNPMAWMHTDSDPDAAHHHSSEDGLMPGMATLAELDALSAARGTDAETLFLQLMLRHHQGGVTMAEAADELLTSGAVKEAVRAMITEQNQEAGIITIVLAQRGAQPLP